MSEWIVRDRVSTGALDPPPRLPVRRSSSHGRRIWTALLAGMVALGVTSFAQPASAFTPSYPVDMTQACRYTYGRYDAGARYLNVINPFSWTCGYSLWTASFPPAASWQWVTLGGVDVQRYCSITYPGSRAVLVVWSALGWRCQR
jgi:hypothetical protein